KPLSSFYIVLEGLLGVFNDAQRKQQLSILGPGEIIGDMSFLEGMDPTEYVCALETSTVLEISRTDCEQKFQAEPTFGTRFFQGLAKSLSQRLRRMNRRVTAEKIDLSQRDHPGAPVMAALENCKAVFVEANEAANKNFNVVPPDLAQQVVSEIYN